MNINASLFVQCIVFFLLAWFTMRFIWPPFMAALDERARKVKEGLEAADQAKRDMVAVEKQVHDELKKVRDENQRRIADAEKRAAVIIEEAMRHADQEAKRLVAEAEEDAKQQLVKARSALRSQVSALALYGAEQILKREVKLTDHTKILEEIQGRL